MPITATYQGPKDGSAVRVKGTRFKPGEPVEVDAKLAKVLEELDGYKFDVKHEDGGASGKSTKTRSKATE